VKQGLFGQILKNFKKNFLNFFLLTYGLILVKRYESYGWHTVVVKDGNSDLAAIEKAIDEAKSVTDKPTLIKVHTTIGFGSAKQGSEAVHGNPLGDKDLGDVKTKFGFDPAQKFAIADDVYKTFDHRAKGKADEDAWNALFEKYAQARTI